MSVQRDVLESEFVEFDHCDENVEVKRYQFFVDDDPVLYLDTMDDEYSAEWPTNLSITEFEEVAKSTFPIYANTPALGMFTYKRKADKTVNSTLDELLTDDAYPDDCNYLELDPEGEDFTIAWSLMEDDQFIVLSVESDDTTPLFSGLRETGPEELFRGLTGEIAESVKSTISRDSD